MILKRLFDVLVALALILVLAPLLAVIGLLVLIVDGWPVLYVSERMKGVNRSFALLKFRTMSVSDSDSGVSGGDKSDRITALGAKLRASRLDELPQLWNVLAGDMSLVGPRPPLRRYVERYPEIYEKVLSIRPGLTGLATLHFHKHEEKILGRTMTSRETELVYVSRCIPRKAIIDLIYIKNYHFCFDIAIMVKTLVGRTQK